MIGAAFLLAARTAGVLFECEPGALQVFAPADKAAAGYWTSANPPVFDGKAQRFEAIDDQLPGHLRLNWRREHNSPVALEIADYDATAGTARVSVSSELNPASRLYTPVTVGGACTARLVEDTSQ